MAINSVRSIVAEDHIADILPEIRRVFSAALDAGDRVRSLLRIILLVLLLRLLVDLLLTLQDFLHELQRVARRPASAEGILNRLGTRRLGRIVGLWLGFDPLAGLVILRVDPVPIVCDPPRTGGWSQ